MKVQIAIDQDKAELKEQYSTAVGWLDEIIANAQTADLAVLRTYLGQIAQIERALLKIVRKQIV